MMRTPRDELAIARRLAYVLCGCVRGTTPCAACRLQMKRRDRDGRTSASISDVLFALMDGEL